MIEDRMAKAHPVVRKAYLDSRRKGNTRAFAEIVALRQSPVYGNCERTFWESQHDAMNRDMTTEERDRILKCAHKAGINTEGKTYCGAIGTYSDPDAWVTTRDDAVQALRRKGKSSFGILKVKSSPVADDPQPCRLAPDIVDRLAKQTLKNEPRLREKVKKGKVSKAALRDLVVSRHALER